MTFIRLVKLLFAVVIGAWLFVLNQGIGFSVLESLVIPLCVVVFGACLIFGGNDDR